MQIENIEMPVLLFSPNYNTVEFIQDKDLLSVTNKLGLKKGIVIGNYVIDSSGKMFKTISAKKSGNFYSVWKFEFFNPLIYIKLEVEKIKENVDLSELKDRVLKIIKQNKEEWENYSDFKKIIKCINESKTHRELIELIGKYIHPSIEK